MLRQSVYFAPEKAEILANHPVTSLIKARAGSGKTTLLGAQTLLLSEGYNVKADEILILAFNRSASREIGTRIREEYNFSGFHQAKTFHSLAYQIVRPEEELLFDEGRTFFGEKQKNFIQGSVRSIWKEKNFEERMLEFFKKEIREIDEHGDNLEPGEYLAYRKNRREVSLAGEVVKSNGEKIVSDFLFQHDIHYRYEERVFVKGDAKGHLGSFYSPDFTIFYEGKRFRLEHWGIDENDNSRRVAPDWDGTWEEYRELSDFVPKHLAEVTTGYIRTSKSVHKDRETIGDTDLDDEIPF